MDDYDLMKKIYLDKDKDNNLLKEEFPNLKRRMEFDSRSLISFSSANKNQEVDTSMTCPSERDDVVKKGEFVEIAENKHLIKNIQEKVIHNNIDK
jgi:hypothetical protein